MSNGLIDRAFLSGSHDPALYYRKYPRIQWKDKGGYEIQTTPAEVAAIITQSRAWVKGSRMLAVGSETLGAERFIAENLGMLDVEFIGNALPHNRDEIKAKSVKVPSGKYDIITVYGTAKVDALLPFTKIGSLVVFLGVGALSKNPALRTSWLAIRKKHMTMLQTGGEAWQTGVGVVKILFVDGQDKAANNESDNAETVARMEPQRVGVGNDKAGIENAGEVGIPVSGEAVPAKRRGRPAKVKA